MKNIELATPWLLCAAALAFPFSVAATNVALGLALASGIVSDQFWLGAKILRQQYKWLSLCLVSYLGLFIIGLLWSNDIDWGLHVLGRQWFWLLVPVVVVALIDMEWRHRFLLALSIGLSLHLAYCVLQIAGYVSVTVQGSDASNATGHIGHIGFGFVYGIWGGWLLHWGWENTGLKRQVAWALSLWAWVMIFAAQGRSGYLVAVAMIFVVLWKHLLSGYGWRRTGITFCLTLTIIALAMAGPGKERVQQTWQSFKAFQQGDMEHAEARWSLSFGAIEIWKTSPVLGVGTGGFPKAAEHIRQQMPELNYDNYINVYRGKEIYEKNRQQMPESNYDDFVKDYQSEKFYEKVRVEVVHPHNAYLFALARWGVSGVVVLVFFLFLWVCTGWRADWTKLQAGPLITLSGVALAVHGLSSSSLEDHFSGILAALLLGIGLAEVIDKATFDPADVPDSSIPSPERVPS